MHGTDDDTYLVAHLHQALVADSRLCEQGLDIEVVSMQRIVVRGEVATPERRDAALEVIRRMAPSAALIDDVHISSARADVQIEQL
jgi:hypothetical protein